MTKEGMGNESGNSGSLPLDQWVALRCAELAARQRYVAPKGDRSANAAFVDRQRAASDLFEIETVRAKVAHKVTDPETLRRLAALIRRATAPTL
jgi:hypothetical protein